MPERSIPLATNEVYHVFNRGIDRRPIFLNKKDYKRALKLIEYYQASSPLVRFSYFIKRSKEEKENIFKLAKKKNQSLVNILCFCLMPNHFHFLLKQSLDEGISKFMSVFQNSYTRYFNARQKRTGPLLQTQFKAVRIETDEQLVHVSRYIHLNPYSSFVVKDVKKLTNYPWSSCSEYIYNKKRTICKTKLISSLFESKQSYRDFVLNQSEYQRELEKIKHLIIEDTKYRGVRRKSPPR